MPYNDPNATINILRGELPENLPPKIRAGYIALTGFGGSTYREFRQTVGPHYTPDERPYSPSKVIKHAIEHGYANLGSEPKPEPEPNNITLNGPLDGVSVFVMEGVDPERSGIYIFVIDGLGTYVGKYTRPSRYRIEYSKNVRRILNNEPYRPNNPDGFRHVHRILAKAVREGKATSLILFENWEDEREGRDRESFLIQAIGTLNR
jgi:hypothetical protein